MTGELTAVRGSVLDQVKNLDAQGFAKWAEGLIDGGMQILNVVNRLVADNTISPVQATGIMACTYGQLFDYQTFHNPNALSQLLHGDSLS